MRAARCLCLAAWLVACARAEDEIVGYEIDEDRLPELSDLLSELGIARVHDAFVDAGFDRTRMLLKMKDMDLKMLVREETLTEAEADALRGRLDVLRDVKKPVKRDVRDPLMERRAKLTYGRLYIERATAARERVAKNPATTTATNDDPKVFPEARVEKPYTTFGAVNYLLEACCVALVRATFLLDYEGPIDVRQTLDAVAGAMFHGPLELGDARWEGSLMPDHVVIALSYTWAPKGPFFGEPGNEDGTKDHPDPEKHYLGIGRRVLGFMLKCCPYNEVNHLGYVGNKREKTFLFWVGTARLSLTSPRIAKFTPCRHPPHPSRANHRIGCRSSRTTRAV